MILMFLERLHAIDPVFFECYINDLVKRTPTEIIIIIARHLSTTMATQRIVLILANIN